MIEKKKNRNRFFKKSASTPENNEQKTIIDNILNTSILSPGALSTGTIEAGYTYLGQMIAHDIVPSTNDHKDRQEISPNLSLNSLYGDDKNCAYFNKDFKFILGKVKNNENGFIQNADVLRDSSGKALIPEPRNDENLIILQLHLLWQKLHNRIIDYLKDNESKGDLFNKARTYTIFIFHEIVKKDYLNKILHPCVIDLYLNQSYSFFYNNASFDNIPVEFSHAAFRFGHAMVKKEYDLNNKTHLLTKNILNKTGQILDEKNIIDWDLFFSVNYLAEQVCEVESLALDNPNSINTTVLESMSVNLDESINKDSSSKNVQFANHINTSIVKGMTTLPFHGNNNDIRRINLTAGFSEKLLSANEIYKELLNTDGIKELLEKEKTTYATIFRDNLPSAEYKKTDDELLQDSISEIPSKKMYLWHFILAEAEISRKNSCTLGLGIIGSVIVAEVVLKSIESAASNLSNTYLEDAKSFIRKELSNDSIRMRDVINFINKEKKYEYRYK